MKLLLKKITYGSMVIKMSKTSKQGLILVGGKPAIKYVTACITLFNRGVDTVVLRARGSSINNCIETYQLLKKSFLKNVKISDIKIGSELCKSIDGKQRLISYIELYITKD